MDIDDRAGLRILEVITRLKAQVEKTKAIGGAKLDRRDIAVLDLDGQVGLVGGLLSPRPGAVDKSTKESRRDLSDDA